MKNQILLFFYFILTGFLISLIFDVFRVLRRYFKTNNFVTSIFDFLFWIIAGYITLYSIMKYNNGILRFYIFIGIILGIIIYILLFSNIFIRSSLAIIKFFKKIIIYPICYIICLLKRVFFSPIKFIKNRININMSNLQEKSKKIIKKRKSKKDLA